MKNFQPSIHWVTWRFEWGYSGQCVKLITDLKTRVDIKNDWSYTPSPRVCLHDVHTGTFILVWRRSKIYITLFCIFFHFPVIYFHWLAFQNKFLTYQYFIPFSCPFFLQRGNCSQRNYINLFFSYLTFCLVPVISSRIIERIHFLSRIVSREVFITYRL